MKLGAYCTKRCENPTNLVTSRKINMRLERPMSKVWSNCVPPGGASKPCESS